MIKKLTAAEMESVIGGVGAVAAAIDGRPDCIINEAERQMYDSFTRAEKDEVCEQPDRSSRRAKMLEIWKRKQNPENNASTTLHVGATGSW